MKQLTIIIFHLTLAISSFGQNYKFIEIDKNYFNIKDSLKDDLTFEQTIFEIENYCTNDTQRVSLIAGWIFNNIDFDLDQLLKGGVTKDYKTVYMNRKGVCGEYSNIFSEFCNRLGIENKIIEGYVPEYNSENKVYYETNHAWNVVRINGKWYHCDLLGFSGYLKNNTNGEFEFVKKENPKSFLTQELSFISYHIPANPMWQLSNFPLPIDTLIKYGINSKIDSTEVLLDFEVEISNYLKMKSQDKLLKDADDSYNYNKNNNNIVIVNYYNASVDLINRWNGDKRKLVLARKYLNKAKEHLIGARNGVETLGAEIEESLKIIKKYVP